MAHQSPLLPIFRALSHSSHRQLTKATFTSSKSRHTQNPPCTNFCYQLIHFLHVSIAIYVAVSIAVCPSSTTDVALKPVILIVVLLYLLHLKPRPDYTNDSSCTSIRSSKLKFWITISVNYYLVFLICLNMYQTQPKTFYLPIQSTQNNLY